MSQGVRKVGPYIKAVCVRRQPWFLLDSKPLGGLRDSQFTRMQRIARMPLVKVVC